MRNIRSLLMTVLGVVISVVLFTGCGSNTYSCKDYYSIEVKGCNGKGYIHVSVNSDMKKLILSENCPEDATDFEEAAYEILLETMEVHCDPSEELSNGDSIDIHVSVDEETFASKGIKFTDTDFTYTVSGLEDPVEVDPFDGLTLTFTGISPKADVEIEYTGTDEFVKNEVKFSADKYRDLSIGDIITVKASFSKNAAEEQNIVITESEKEYTVSGVDEYLNSEVDFSELNDLFYNEITDILAGSENYGVGAETDSRGFFSDAISRLDQYTVKGYEITPFREELRYSSNSYQSVNTYAVFYKLNFEVEKTKTASGIYYRLSDGKELGFTGVSDDIYMCIYVNDIVKKTDGTIYYDKEEIKSRGWTTSLFGNFIGADFSEIMSDYEINVSSNDIVYSKDLV